MACYVCRPSGVSRLQSVDKHVESHVSEEKKVCNNNLHKLTARFYIYYHTGSAKNHETVLRSLIMKFIYYYSQSNTAS